MPCTVQDGQLALMQVKLIGKLPVEGCDVHELCIELCECLVPLAGLGQVIHLFKDVDLDTGYLEGEGWGEGLLVVPIAQYRPIATLYLQK